MAGAEPLNKEGSPPTWQSSKVKLKMKDKMVQIKKVKNTEKVILSTQTTVEICFAQRLTQNSHY